MDKKYIVANWKMNPQTLAEAEQILDYINDHFESRPETQLSLIVCPPFVFLDDIGKILQSSHLEHNSELGAQDIALAETGAWTGEVSGPMLKRLGVQYVIIGHSERRWKLGEPDEVVNKKLKTALGDELIPIVCIGERKRDKDFKAFLKQQITATFAGLSADEVGKCLVAYEPVWAISSNPGAKPDTPEDTLQAIAVIKETLSQDTLVLYGGSVTSKNAKDFLSLADVAGVLVGGASIRKEEFVEILNIAETI